MATQCHTLCHRCGRLWPGRAVLSPCLSVMTEAWECGRVWGRAGPAAPCPGWPSPGVEVLALGLPSP